MVDNLFLLILCSVLAMLFYRKASRADSPWRSLWMISLFFVSCGGAVYYLVKALNYG